MRMQPLLLNAYNITQRVLLLFAFAITSTASLADEVEHVPGVNKAKQIALKNTERQVLIDFDKGHPFIGFGAVIWPGSPFPEQRLNVMKSTNMNWVRVPLVSYFRLADYRLGMTVKDLLEQRSEHPIRAKLEKLSKAEMAKLKEADLRTTERYRALAEELKQSKIGLIVAALTAPPKEWMQTFRSGDAIYTTFKGGQPGQTDHRRDYINIVVAEVAAARQAGLHIDAIEFPGEPDMPASGMRPDVADSMVGILRKVMNSNGLSTIAILAPGTAVTFSAPRYIDALQSRKGNVNLIKYFSVHDYDTVKRPAPAGLSPELLTAVKNTRPIIVTEFGDGSKRWREPPYSGGPKHASREEQLSRTNATNHSEYGVALAAEGLKLIGDGACGVCIWQMNDIYWMDSAYGMIDVSGNLRPVATAFTTFMKFLDKRAEIHSFQGRTGPGMAVTAFTVSAGGQKHIVVAIANITNSPIQLSLKLVGGSAAFEPKSGGLEVAAQYPEADSVVALPRATKSSLRIPANCLVVLKDSH